MKSFSNIKILIVEDENIVALDIKNQLNNLGCSSTSTVSSGEKAISTVPKLKPDLILMDIMLKGEVNGINAAKVIRYSYNIPIIYLSAYSDQHTLETIKVTEPFGYLLKPFEERELRTTIEMALYRHDIETMLKESEQWLSTTLSSIGEAVIATDSKGRIRFMNAVAERLLGFNQDEALGRQLTKVFVLVDEKDRKSIPNPIKKALVEGMATGTADNILLINRQKKTVRIDYNIAPIKNESGQVTGVVLVFKDVTDRKTYEEKIHHLAYYDQLTDLPNRSQFNEELLKTVESAKNAKNNFAVMFIDLDKFKNVNDTLGHDIGDLLLKESAVRLKSCIRKNDIVSRQGGDEFTLIIQDIRNEKDAKAVALKIIDTLSRPFTINDNVITVTPSVGISIYPNHSEKIETLIMYADSAMYSAKREGGNTYRFYFYEVGTK